MKWKRPRLNSRFWNSDKLFGLTAMIISLVTLIIFVKQTNIMDNQTRLSVLPYLMIEQSTNSEAHRIQLSLVNHGVGPAIIESRKIRYKGKEYDQDFYTFLTESVPELDSIEPFNWSNVYKGLAIPANGRITMVAVGNDPQEFQQFMQIIGKLQSDSSFYFEVVYKSIYGDKWKLSSDSEVPEKLE